MLRTSGGIKLTDTSDLTSTVLFWTQLDNFGGGEWVRSVNLVVDTHTSSLSLSKGLSQLL